MDYNFSRILLSDFHFIFSHLFGVVNKTIKLINLITEFEVSDNNMFHFPDLSAALVNINQNNFARKDVFRANTTVHQMRFRIRHRRN